MMDVHLKTEESDVQIVPDFSDLLDAIVEDTSDDVRIRRLSCYSHIPLIESLSEQWDEEGMFSGIDRTPAKKNERGGTALFDEHLLTPPVERLLGKAESRPSEVFRFPPPAELEDENTSIRHEENPLVTSMRCTSVRDSFECTGVVVGPDCVHPRDRGVTQQSHSVCSGRMQAGEASTVNDIGVWNSAILSPSSYKPPSHCSLSCCPQLLDSDGLQLLCQENENGECGAVKCFDVADATSSEYGYSNGEVSLNSSSNQPRQKRRPGTLVGAILTGEVLSTPTSTQLESCLDYARVEARARSPSRPAHQTCTSVEFHVEPASDCSAVANEEISGVSELDENTSNRSTYFDMDEQPSSPFPLQCGRTTGPSPGNITSDRGGRFPPKTSTALMAGHVVFPPFSAYDVEYTPSVEAVPELGESMECGTRKTSKPGKNKGNDWENDNFIRFQRSYEKIVARQATNKHEQPSVQVPSNGRYSKKGSDKKNNNGTVVGYQSPSKGKDSNVNVEQVHNLMSALKRCRQGHKEAERRRSLNKNFEKLRKVVPRLLTKPRAAKPLILVKAREYIDALTKKEGQLRRVEAEQRAKNAVLLERYLKLIRTARTGGEHKPD